MESMPYLVIIAVITFCFAVYLKSRTRYSKVSTFQMFVYILYGAVCSAIISFAFFYSFYYLDISIKYFLLGFAEELAKIGALCAVFKISNNKEHEPLNLVVISIAVAFGSSIAVDILSLYFNESRGIHFLFMNGISSLVTSVFVAITLSNHLASLSKGSFWNPFFAFCFMHGLLNLVISHTHGAIFIVIAAGGAIAHIQYLTLISPRRKSFIKELKRFKEDEILPCLSCQKKELHQIYIVEGLTLAECISCKNVLLSEKKAQELLSLFLPKKSGYFFDSFDLNMRLKSFYEEFPDKNYNMYRKFNIAVFDTEVEKLVEESRQKFEGGMVFRIMYSKRPVYNDFRDT